MELSDMNCIVRNFLNTLGEGLYVLEGERPGVHGHTRLPTMIQVSWNMIDTVYADAWCENEHGEACYRLHANGKLGHYPTHVNFAQNREVLWGRTVLGSFPDLTTGDILNRVMSVPATPDVSWPLLLRRHPLVSGPVLEESIHGEEESGKDSPDNGEARAGEARP